MIATHDIAVTPLQPARARPPGPDLALPGMGKIQPSHLERLAVVYVRQSSPQQVLHHRESTELQYKLVERAAALGWAPDRISVIDDDQGLSGRSAEGRAGFQRLLAEVGLDQVGLVLGIEMSRLARSCKDWHNLLEICALFGTLLADQDGLYDPGNYNDRLLLGLKGTMSEAELHILKCRMLQGKLNKAARGEIFSHAPTGYLRDERGQLTLDPDQQVQHVVHLVFQKLQELGTINAAARYLHQNDIRLGMRPHHGLERGRLVWRAATRGTVRNMIRNPVYAGAYAYGRFKIDPKRKVTGRRCSGRMEMDVTRWSVLLKNHLPAYITWEQYEKNLKLLADNQARAQSAMSLGAPRNGAALLGGILHCACCCGRMSPSYGGRAGAYRYSCDRNGLKHGGLGCQSVKGEIVDAVIAEQLLAALEPAALELSCLAREAFEQERQQLERHWGQRMQRARYDVDLAKRRYETVDPANRLVAQSLENAWEAALRVAEETDRAHQRFVDQQPGGLSEQQRADIARLAQDIPAIWHAPTTQPLDRQQIVRLLIERVTLDTHGRGDRMDIRIGWQGGVESCHEATRIVWCFEQMERFPQLLERARELRQAGHSQPSIARMMTAEGYRSPRHRQQFSSHAVGWLLAHGSDSKDSFGKTPPLRRRSYADELAHDERWLADVARELGMPYVSLHAWIGRGWIRARKIQQAGGMLAVKSDERELERLRRLREHRVQFPHHQPPSELLPPLTVVERNADTASNTMRDRAPT